MLFKSKKVIFALGQAMLEKHQYATSNPEEAARLLGEMVNLALSNESIPDDLFEQLMQYSEKKTIMSGNFMDEEEFTAFLRKKDPDIDRKLIAVAVDSQKNAYDRSDDLKFEKAIKNGVELIARTVDPIESNANKNVLLQHFKNHLLEKIFNDYRSYTTGEFFKLIVDKNSENFIKNNMKALNCIKLLAIAEGKLNNHEMLLNDEFNVLTHRPQHIGLFKKSEFNKLKKSGNLKSIQICILEKFIPIKDTLNRMDYEFKMEEVQESVRSALALRS